METVTRRAWDLDTNQEYEIELPADNLVEKVLLGLDYPPDGLQRAKVVEILAERFSLTDEQKNAKNKVGQRVFNFYVGIMIPGLVKSGKVIEPKYGWISVNTAQISGQGKTIRNDSDNSDGFPEESIEENYQKIQKGLAEDLLQQIKANSPTFFEELVIDLLVAMGYGGSREDARAVGRSGDGGIDGIIKADPLGLNVVYVQAKRWEGNVGAPPVRDFVGALDGEGVQDGIFITTSDFNPAAKSFAERSSKRVILINGSQLARYMINHNVGVSTVETYEIKRVDSDYFTENAENS